MNLDQLVCRRELAEEMKALGVRQDSIFVWSPEGELFNGRFDGKDTAAFTSVELGEMLPSAFISYRGHNGLWACYCMDSSTLNCRQNEYADNEVDARAQMLIYLIKQKLISVEEINRRMGE